MPAKITINSPIINELVFDYLFSLTPEQKRRFTPKELRAVKTAKKARHFVEKATMDEKMLILAKLGVGFSFVLHDKNNLLTKKEIKERYAKYTEMSLDKHIQEASDERFVVLTDRVLINYMNLMGNFTHSDVYLLNLDFHRIGESINAWKKADSAPTVGKIRQSADYAKQINKLLLAAAMEQKAIRMAREQDDVELLVLYYLNSKQNEYVRRETLQNDFTGFYTPIIIGGAFKRLREKLYIDRNPEILTREEYQITTLGIEYVGNVIKKILHKSV